MLMMRIAKSALVSVLLAAAIVLTPGTVHADPISTITIGPEATVAFASMSLYRTCPCITMLVVDDVSGLRIYGLKITKEAPTELIMGTDVSFTIEPDEFDRPSATAKATFPHTGPVVLKLTFGGFVPQFHNYQGCGPYPLGTYELDLASPRPTLALGQLLSSRESTINGLQAYTGGCQTFGTATVGRLTYGDLEYTLRDSV